MTKANSKKDQAARLADLPEIFDEARRIVFGPRYEPPKRYQGVAKSDSTAATLADIPSPQSGKLKRNV